MEDQDYYTLRAMSIYGGSFVKALAVLAWSADPNNLEKIKGTWPEYWSEYQKMGEKLPREE